jgi:hypothetical protein
MSRHYVTRFGFTPTLVFSLVIFFSIAAGFVWMATYVMKDPGGQAFALLTIAFFGGNGLFTLVGALRRGVALRMDDSGVTLGRTPGLITDHGLFGRGPVTSVPWGDIDAVVLFDLTAPRSATQSFIGLRLRSGAIHPPREPTRLGIWRRVGIWMGQEPPPHDVNVYRQIFGWRLDKVRLVKTVAACAKDVSVLELKSGHYQTIRPLRRRKRKRSRH